jgi:triosephosphate isomerase
VSTKKLIVGNWKMNLNVHEASLYVHKLASMVQSHRNVEVVLAPGMVTLQSLSLQIDRRQFKLAAQNMYWRDEGAFTGEVSAHQLRGLVDYAIIGHSERRHIFHEQDKDIRAKVQAAVRNGITPILCVGETAHERAAGETAGVLHDQVVGGLANLTAEEVAGMVIAYEPVWAISNGKDFADHQVPTPVDMEHAQRLIRSQIKHLFGEDTAGLLRILYGGSANSSNSKSYLNAHGVDGLLVGGASLKADEFTQIVEAAYESGRKK